MSTELTIKPILNDVELEEATERLYKLSDSVAGSPERLEWEILAALIETYEHDIDMTPKEFGTFAEYLEAYGLKQADIADLVGGSGRASELVKGTRRLSIAMMKALNDAYGMPFDRLMKFAGPEEKTA